MGHCNHGSMLVNGTRQIELLGDLVANATQDALDEIRRLCKPRAQRRRGDGMTRFGWVAIAVAGGLAVLVGLAMALAGVTALRAVFVGVNVVTMLAYGYDKHLARIGGQRVPEMTLHVLAAIGGTPGAFVGQLLFRHKTRDRWFRLVFFAIAAVQVVVLLVIVHLRSG